MKKYDEMYKLMQYKQTHAYNEAWRHIQRAMEGDTLTKTGQNRQCIDNVRDYDRDYNRIEFSAPYIKPSSKHAPGSATVYHC